ncbi:MAG TPA: hypothetical protein VKY85_06140 [Candidatus Angelobacter sp.]|nr:hypothetical protein [Candidatus Angelobacter sp.]
MAGVILFWRGGLDIGTARFYFFLYLACLLVIAAAFSKVSKLSYAILVWCTIELGLGLGSLILKVEPSLFPENATTTEGDAESLAFIYHPLLQYVPRPNWQYTHRIDFRRFHFYDQAKAFGIDVASLQGQELTFVHNSLGARGKELTKSDLAKDLIFVYGGSSTYDQRVTQGETWAEQLQADLNNKYTVVNFGIVGHTTAENLIQTAFYQDVLRKRPACAIYYVGWNDAVNNAHIEQLDSAYADYHLLLMAQRKPDLFVAQYSPLGFLVNQVAQKRFDTVPYWPQILGKPPVAGRDEHLEAIVIGNVKTIAAMNAARGIKTIVIGQIANSLWSDPPLLFSPLVKEGDAVPLVEGLKSALKGAAVSIGVKYIDPGIKNFEGSDFVDEVHFASRGSKKFASLISKEVGDYCR